MTELTIYRPDGSSEMLRADLARNRVYLAPHEWSLVKPPPLNWERTVPRYRLTRDLQPAMKDRFRFEAPYTDLTCGDSWQYGEKFHQAGAEIESTCWPHPSMRPAGPIDDPAHYAAERVLEFFNAAMRSRLQHSPWRDGCLHFEDGLSGPLPGHVSTPKVAPMNLRPVA
jgi:hypothetical protein